MTHTAPSRGRSKSAQPPPVDPRFDWRRIAYHVLVSRALDAQEETTNRNRTTAPREHLVLYQFSARGHDVGVVCNMPGWKGATVLPMSGDVGSQYTPTAGWAQSITYRRSALDEQEWDGAIAVALGGEASVATNGFWSALTIATTLELP